VTDYARDHPGGAEALQEVAGQDATSAYEDVGHSEDAREIMQPYLVGVVIEAAGDTSRPPKSAVHVVRRGPSKKEKKASTILSPRLELAAFSISTVSLAWYLRASHIMPRAPELGGFHEGFLVATVISGAVGMMGYRFLSQALDVGKDFTAYPAHITASHIVKSTNRPAGILRHSEYQRFKLIQKDELAKDIYRFVFELPGNGTILGLPIGQHIAIRGYWDDGDDHHTITRSYTPVSNNRDLGRLELVIRCYPDGLLTGKFLVKLEPGDTAEIRGPTGAMRYRKGMCRRIGMIAGGTGITPM
jgi:cytochrome-b5 reductase